MKEIKEVEVQGREVKALLKCDACSTEAIEKLNRDILAAQRIFAERWPCAAVAREIDKRRAVLYWRGQFWLLPVKPTLYPLLNASRMIRALSAEVIVALYNDLEGEEEDAVFALDGGVKPEWAEANRAFRDLTRQQADEAGEE